MATVPSTRRVTEEQFNQGTTLDGNRLDRAFKGVDDTFNNLQPGDVQRRHHAQHYVSGWQPAIRRTFTLPPSSFPFMRIFNQVNDVVGGQGGIPPNLEIQNPLRVKGSYNPGIPLTSNWVGIEGTTQYVWTQTWFFTEPVTLAGFTLWMCGDFAYPNDFVYGTGTPGHTDGKSVDDILIDISVADPSNPEVTNSGALVYHKLAFQAATEDSLPNGAFINAPADMLPAHPTGPVHGFVAIADLDLNRPLPRDSRLRISITIPQYPAVFHGGGWRQAPEPWMGQTYSAVLTTLEPTHV